MGSGSSTSMHSNSVEDISSKKTSSLKNRPSSTTSSSRVNQISSNSCRDGGINCTRSEETFHKAKRSEQPSEDILKRPLPKTLAPLTKGQNSTNMSPVIPLGSAAESGDKSLGRASDNCSRDELMGRLKEAELELARSESQRLDLADRVQLLEEKISSDQARDTTGAGLGETIHAKDQYIVKLEKDLKTSQAESTAMRLKLKRRIKALANQLHEVRQDASISQLELKSEIAHYREKSNMAKGSSGATEPPTDLSAQDSTHSSLVVELSNQLSEQGQKIAALEEQVSEKDALIERLQARRSPTPPTHQHPDAAPVRDAEVNSIQSADACSVDRLRSGRGARVRNIHTSAAPRETARPVREESAWPDPPSRQEASRMSTALSDSDSDWGTEDSPGQPHTHSAPARVRVKSAQAKPDVAKDAGLQGDDDSVLGYLGQPPVPEGKPSLGRVPAHRKSALKSHLEKRRKESQARALIGPSIAFATMTTEFPSDTSCEPTPRYREPGQLPGFSKLTIVNAVKN